MAAAFDDELIYDVADSISTEMRAFANGGHAGLGVFTPNINPFKDPRWGRGKETPGEDPFHVSSYTRALLSGLEAAKAHDVKKIVATCKHFAAYDLEYFHNVSRYQFNAEVSTQDLAEYYMPSFEACARDMQAGSTMCSYNAVNGVPSCANDWLMQDVLRDHWKWNAPDHYISSDCFAIDVIETSHNYTTTHEQTAAVAMKAGTDNDCGAFYRAHLGAAVNQSLVDMDVVNRAVARAYGGKLRVGYFDPPTTNPYRNISWSAVNTPASRSLARKSATSGMTLLKNLNSTLPLKSPDGCGKNLSIALVGEWANATLDMIAGYSGIPPFLHSPLFGLQQISGVTVNLAEGLNDTAMAMDAADKSDIVIYVGGGDESSEAEGLDRTSIAWNSTQSALIDAMASVGKPFVMVKTGATQLDDSAWLANDNVSAILWMGYPGQDGGPAMADVLFGKVAPAGRLPVTQYPSSYIDKVSEFDMSLRPHRDSPGRTYKWYNGDAVLPFGYGLHYTNFSAKAWSRDLSNMSSDGLIQNCSTPAYEHIDRCVIGHIEVAVSNTKDTCSDYVALAFVNGDFGPEPRPLKSLVAYDRLHDVMPGEIQYASMPLTLGSIARWDEQGRRILYPGTYQVSIDTAPELAGFRFTISGEEKVLETWPQQRKN